jgi:hypothetical protein
MGTMNVVAVITWFSAAAGGLFLLAARLTGYTSDFQGAAAGAVRPGRSSDLRRPAAARSATAQRGMGAMT